MAFANIKKPEGKARQWFRGWGKVLFVGILVLSVFTRGFLWLFVEALAGGVITIAMAVIAYRSHCSTLWKIMGGIAVFLLTMAYISYRQYTGVG